MFRHILPALCLFFSACGIAAPSPVEQIASKCAKAVVSKDYKTVTACTHHRIVEASGGPKVFEDTMADAMRKMAAEGTVIVSATTGTPGKETRVGTWLTVIIPEKIELRTADSDISADSYLLGISENGGKTWSVIDIGGMPKETIQSLYPEFAGKLTLPEASAPVVTKRKS